MEEAKSGLHDLALVASMVNRVLRGLPRVASVNECGDQVVVLDALAGIPCAYGLAAQALAPPGAGVGWSPAASGWVASSSVGAAGWGGSSKLVLPVAMESACRMPTR